MSYVERGQEAGVEQRLAAHTGTLVYRESCVGALAFFGLRRYAAALFLWFFWEIHLNQSGGIAPQSKKAKPVCGRRTNARIGLSRSSCIGVVNKTYTEARKRKSENGLLAVAFPQRDHSAKPAWSIMEYIAGHQLQDGRWEKTDSGYRLHGLSTVPRPPSPRFFDLGPWQLAGMGLVVLVSAAFIVLCVRAVRPKPAKVA